MGPRPAARREPLDGTALSGLGRRTASPHGPAQPNPQPLAHRMRLYQ